MADTDASHMEINLEEQYPEPKELKGKKTKNSNHIETLEDIKAHLNANPFLVGLVIGLLIASVLVYVSMSVQLDKAQLEVLRVHLDYKKKDLGAGGGPDVQQCSANQTRMLNQIGKMKDEAATDKITIQEYALRCLQCSNTSAAVSQNAARMESECTESIGPLKTDLEKLRAEQMIWEREKTELTNDIKSTVANTFKSAKDSYLKDMENHKRTLEVAHHVEVTELKARTEKSERLLAMSQQDRDQAIQDAKAVEEEKIKCLAENTERTNGHTGELDKIMGEMEALSGAVAQCQKTAAAHENSVCQLCDHCSNVNFPVCKRCHRQG